MAKEENQKVSEVEDTKKAKDWFPSFSKMRDFVLGVLQLQRSIETLREQNKVLAGEVKALQRQFDEQSGELKTIKHFIETAINDRAARSGEQAAFALIEKIMSSQK